MAMQQKCEETARACSEALVAVAVAVAVNVIQVVAVEAVLEVLTAVASTLQGNIVVALNKGTRVILVQ
jgi:hypothetical protein